MKPEMKTKKVEAKYLGLGKQIDFAYHHIKTICSINLIMELK